MANSKKESRIMRVTMDSEEFEKYDKGITHSNRGLRNKDGRLSALPDISPISDDDTFYLKTPHQETLYTVEKSEVNSVGATICYALIEVIADVINDPEIQKDLAKLGKSFWYYKVKPKINKAIHRLKIDKKFKTKASPFVDYSVTKSDVRYELEVIDKSHKKIIISGENAAQLVGMIREEARRLSAMIYLLSNITVKDDKSQEECMIEQEYIKQLVSSESKSTMEMLVANRNLLDKESVICFSDFLSGYIRHENQRISIPAIDIKNKSTEDYN